MPAPTPAIPIFSTGDILTQTSMAGITSNLTNLYNFLMGGFRTLKPICSIRVTSTISMPNATNFTIPFDVADINYDNMWVATGNDHMTVNTAGVYRIDGNGGHSGSFSTVGFYLCVNGANPTTNSVGSASANSNHLAASATISLAVGATIYMVIIQNTGAAQNVATTFGGTRLSAEWLSP